MQRVDTDHEILSSLFRVAHKRRDPLFVLFRTRRVTLRLAISTRRKLAHPATPAFTPLQRPLDRLHNRLSLTLPIEPDKQLGRIRHNCRLARMERYKRSMRGGVLRSKVFIYGKVIEGRVGRRGGVLAR
jgi:hypothetical protein